MASTYNILFVCLENTCQSPMAEAIFSDIVKKNGLDGFFPKIDSAGTVDYHIGSPPFSPAYVVCEAHHIRIIHVARKITLEDFDSYDYIFCMNERNLARVKRIQPDKIKAVVKLFDEFDPQRKLKNNDYDHENNFLRYTRCSENFLRQLDLLF